MAREDQGLIPAPGTLVQRLRMASGLVLFAYLFTHLGNHALGLIDIDTMQWARHWRLAVTRSLPGQVILIAAALIHLALGAYKFIERRTLRISFAELLQLGFGLLIPLLLMRHILGTRGTKEFFGIDDNYYYALWAMWPSEALPQAILITLAWVHATIGLFYWLRLKTWFLRLRPWFIAIAVLWPVLAYVGFVSAARIVQLETDPAFAFTPEQYAFLKGAMAWSLGLYAGFLVILVGVRIGRGLYERYRPAIEVAYIGGETVRAPTGYTLLEISRMNDIPHASICGGRARCSTCRVRVVEGLDAQPPAEPAERRVLDRIGAAANVRLACQLKPVADLTVATLLPARRDATLQQSMFDRYYWGVEERVTILFCDLRGFTAMSEKRLPFDVVFMLNQYLSRMAEVIEDAGGYVDKFIGDGIMAIFGMGRPADEGARAAMAAAKAMGGVLDALNQSLINDLSKPLDVAIGIETGTAILGRIGMGGKNSGSQHLTALGDTVNAASRLETACREEHVQCLISMRTIEAAAADASSEEHKQLNVKGKSEPLEAVALARAVAIPLDWTRATAA